MTSIDWKANGDSTEHETNALQKFFQDYISKEEYDNFIKLIEEKLQHLEVEKIELQKIMAESYSTNNLLPPKKINESEKSYNNK